MSRILRVAAAIAVVCATGVAAAPASQAATNVPITCTEDVTIYGVPGDQFTLDLAPSCGDILVDPYYVLSNSWTNGASGALGWLENLRDRSDGWEFSRGRGSTNSVPTELLVTNAVSQTLSVGSPIAVIQLAGGGEASRYYIIYGGVPAPSSGTDGGWTVVRQGLPLPASGACELIADADYAWGTGVTGGWQRAWESWAGPADGAGGWACLRALVNKGGDSWTVDNSVL